MPARQTLAAMLCLAFALSLAACGGGGGGGGQLYQYWNAVKKSYFQVARGTSFYHSCVTLEGEPVISAYDESKGEQSDYFERVDEQSRNYKTGDTVCGTWKDIPGPLVTHIQTKENEFTIHFFEDDEDMVSYDGTILRRAHIDDAFVDKSILGRTVILGLNAGVKYGVFDNIEEHRRVDESQVTGSTSATDTTEVGIVFPTLYRTQYGVAFGDSETTTTIKRTGKRIEVERQHSVRFYHDKPNTDAYFDLAITAKSMQDMLGDEFEIVHSVPPADYYREYGEPVSGPPYGLK